MTVLQGSFMVLGLGSSDVKYMWKGEEIVGVTKIFVYKGTSVTLTVADKSLVPLEALKAYGIKVKEVK